MMIPTRALAWAAAELGAKDSRFISAVAAKESARKDRYPNGFLKGLHEAHIFGELTRHRFSQEKYKNIPLSTDSYRHNIYPSSYADVKGVFEAASRLDAEAARDASSWGLFQPLGRNSLLCGWDTSLGMWNDFDRNPVAQVVGFVNFCKARKIDDNVAVNDFDGFAYVYNGSKYAERKYHIKLRGHYNENQPVGWLVDANPELKRMADSIKIDATAKTEVLGLQKMINRTGLVAPLKEDGITGPNTQRALLICLLSIDDSIAKIDEIVDALEAKQS